MRWGEGRFVMRGGGRGRGRGRGRCDTYSRGMKAFLALRAGWAPVLAAVWVLLSAMGGWVSE